MTIQELIEKLNNKKAPSSFDYDRDFNNHLKDIENIIYSFNKNKVNSFCKLIDENLRIKNFDQLDYTIGILSSIYDFEGNDERIISKKIIKIIEILIESYKSKDEDSILWNLYKTFDIYFHNPGLINELEDTESEILIQQITKIATIRYKENSDFELINRKIIGCLSYFKHSNELEELKTEYRSHFDIQVRNQASKLK